MFPNHIQAYEKLFLESEVQALKEESAGLDTNSQIKDEVKDEVKDEEVFDSKAMKEEYSQEKTPLPVEPKEEAAKMQCDDDVKEEESELKVSNPLVYSNEKNSDKNEEKLPIKTDSNNEDNFSEILKVMYKAKKLNSLSDSELSKLVCLLLEKAKDALTDLGEKIDIDIRKISYELWLEIEE